MGCCAFETLRLVNNGTYEGNIDTQLERGLFFGDSDEIEWDGSDVAVLLKWAIFSREGGPIPDGSLVYTAKLHFYKTNQEPGDEGRIHEVLVHWNESTTFETFGSNGGVRPAYYVSDDVATIAASVLLGRGWKDETVTTSLRKWTNPEVLENNGWIIVAGTISVSLGYEIASSEAAANRKPYLVIEYDNPEAVNCATFQDRGFQDSYAPPIHLYTELCVACDLPSRASSASLNTSSVSFQGQKITVDVVTPPSGWSLGFCFDVPSIEKAEGDASLEFSLTPFNSKSSLAYNLAVPDKLDCTTVKCDNDTMVIENNFIINQLLHIEGNVIFKGDLVGQGDISISGNLTVEGCLNVTGGINVILNNSRTYEDGEIIAKIDYTCREFDNTIGITGGTTRRNCENYKASSQATHTGSLIVVNIDKSNCKSQSLMVYVIPIVVIVIIVVTSVIIAWIVYRWYRRKKTDDMIEDSVHKHMQTNNSSMPPLDTRDSESVL